MYGLMLFLHLTGLFIWLGSLLAKLITLSMLKKELGSEQTRTFARRIIRVFSMLSHPSAVIVLISGIFMIVRLGMGSDKPLWLDVMEKGGGTVILLALIVMGILGRRTKKQLKSGQASKINFTVYLTATGSFMILVSAIVLIVSMKI